jgi:hypothetical protein
MAYPSCSTDSTGSCREAFVRSAGPDAPLHRRPIRERAGETLDLKCIPVSTWDYPVFMKIRNVATGPRREP